MIFQFEKLLLVCLLLINAIFGDGNFVKFSQRRIQRLSGLSLTNSSAANLGAIQCALSCAFDSSLCFAYEYNWVWKSCTLSACERIQLEFDADSDTYVTSTPYLIIYKYDFQILIPFYQQ